MAPRGGATSRASPIFALAAGSGGAGGSTSQLSGIATSRFSAAQIRQASRQPKACSNHAEAGQPTVLAKPAIKVIPVIDARASRPYSRVKVAKAGSYDPIALPIPTNSQARVRQHRT